MRFYLEQDDRANERETGDGEEREARIAGKLLKDDCGMNLCFQHCPYEERAPKRATQRSSYVEKDTRCSLRDESGAGKWLTGRKAGECR